MASIYKNDGEKLPGIDDTLVSTFLSHLPPSYTSPSLLHLSDTALHLSFFFIPPSLHPFLPPSLLPVLLLTSPDSLLHPCPSSLCPFPFSLSLSLSLSLFLFILALIASIMLFFRLSLPSPYLLSFLTSSLLSLLTYHPSFPHNT